MKKIIVSLLLSAPVIAFAQESPYQIKGQIGKLDAAAKVFLSYRADGKFVTDSTAIKDGSFEFKGAVE